MWWNPNPNCMEALQRHDWKEVNMCVGKHHSFQTTNHNRCLVFWAACPSEERKANTTIDKVYQSPEISWNFTSQNLVPFLSGKFQTCGLAGTERCTRKFNQEAWSCICSYLFFWNQNCKCSKMPFQKAKSPYWQILSMAPKRTKGTFPPLPPAHFWTPFTTELDWFFASVRCLRKCICDADYVRYVRFRNMWIWCFYIICEDVI